jgi:hypothetical protein
LARIEVFSISIEPNTAVFFVEYAYDLIDVNTALHPPGAGSLSIYFCFQAWRAVVHDELIVRHSNYVLAGSAGAEKEQQREREKAHLSKNENGCSWAIDNLY